MTTWTPKTEQPETWTELAQQTRAFDPYSFDRRPSFDTGETGGIWDLRSQQTETWAPK